MLFIELGMFFCKQLEAKGRWHSETRLPKFCLNLPKEETDLLTLFHVHPNPICSLQISSGCSWFWLLASLALPAKALVITAWDLQKSSRHILLDLCKIEALSFLKCQQNLCFPFSPSFFPSLSSFTPTLIPENLSDQNQKSKLSTVWTGLDKQLIPRKRAVFRKVGWICIAFACNIYQVKATT